MPAPNYYDVPFPGPADPNLTKLVNVTPDMRPLGFPNTWKHVKGTWLAGEARKYGVLVGKVTASGKYRPSIAAASDGSQVPAGILTDIGGTSAGLDASLPTTSDVECMVLVGGEVFEGEVTFGAGHSIASTQVALQDLGILLRRQPR